MKYPFPCSRCGFCCIVTPCCIALEKVPGAKKGECCPALDIGLAPSDTESKCTLIEAYIKHRPDLEKDILEAFGAGAGCCVKATAIDTTSKRSCDFAGLPENQKRWQAMRLYHQRIPVGMTPRIWLDKIKDVS